MTSDSGSSDTAAAPSPDDAAAPAGGGTAEGGRTLDPRAWSRRRLLAAIGGGGAAAAGGVLGSQWLVDPDDAPTTALDEDRARDLAATYAPDVYYDEHERWFMTDPRAYESEADGRTVVDGFDAFDGYARDRRAAEDPPRPVAFYNARRYEDSPLAVVQYWLYAAFDQFTTNFHWHDWEVLHAFVDLEEEEPVLYVASSHGRSVPNNEFLDPETDPVVIAELGSHSSALSVNEVRDRFQRFPDGDLVADVTNRALEAVEDLAALPLAYGLPRDEGVRLPFAVPTLEGAPLFEDDRLPNVDREEFVPPELTARSYEDLARPPEDLPLRSTGLQFTPAADSAPDADCEYALEPASAVEHVDAFTGPRLSFEFRVPDVAEDQLAGHLTTTETPWTQPRYENPAADITDRRHRNALAERYDAIDPADAVGVVAGALRELVPDEDAPEDNGVTTREFPTMGFALLESDPTAVPSWAGGGVVLRGVDPGEHRLTVNAPGAAPYGERLTAAEGEVATAGVEGRVALTASEDAVKVEADATDGPDLARVAVEDDFGGRLLSFRPDSPDGFAAYVHRSGAYTAEIRDREDVPGAYRINPGDEARRTIEDPQTGPTPLSTFVADVARETAEQVPAFAGSDDDGDQGASGDDAPDPSGTGDPTGDASGIDVQGQQGLQRALYAVAESAEHAAERAAENDAPGLDRALRAARDRLDRVLEALERNEFDATVDATVRARVGQATRRVDQARAAAGTASSPSQP